MASSTLQVTLSSAPASGHLILALASATNSKPEVTSGWTQLYLMELYGQAPYIGVWYRVAQPGDSATQTVATFITPTNYAAIAYDISNIGKEPFLLFTSGESSYPGDSFSISQATLANNTVAFYIASNTQGNPQTLTLSNNNFVQDLTYFNTSGQSFNAFAGHTNTPYSNSSIVSSTFTISPSGEVEPFGGILVFVATNVSNVTSYRTPSENLLLNDAAYKTFIRTVSDMIAFADSISKFKTFGEFPTETIAVSDALTAHHTLAKMVADSLQFNELLRTIAAYHSNPVENLRISESLLYPIMHFESVTQSNTISDAVMNLFTRAGNIYENQSVYDALQSIVSAKRSLADSNTESDSVKQQSTFSRKPTDTNPLTDSITDKKSASTNASENISISDMAAKGNIIIKSVSDSIQIIDTASKILHAIKSATESNNISESLSEIQSLLRSKSDRLPLTDLALRFIQTSKTASESILLSDSILSGAIKHASTNESLNNSDKVATSFGRLLHESIYIYDAVLASFALTSYAMYLQGLYASQSLKANITSTITFNASIQNELILNGDIQNEVILPVRFLQPR